MSPRPEEVRSNAANERSVGDVEFPRLEPEHKPDEISESVEFSESETDLPVEDAIKTVMKTERLGEPGERGLRKKDLAEIRTLDGNDYCIDCGKIQPDHASINLGIFMCQLCSIQHQELGSHVSKIRSIKAKDWAEPQVRLMKCGGNKQCVVFLKRHGLRRHHTIQQRYDCAAAMLYQEVLRARRDGRPEPTELPDYVPMSWTENNESNSSLGEISAEDSAQHSQSYSEGMSLDGSSQHSRDELSDARPQNPRRSLVSRLSLRSLQSSPLVGRFRPPASPSVTRTPASPSVTRTPASPSTIAGSPNGRLLQNLRRLSFRKEPSEAVPTSTGKKVAPPPPGSPEPVAPEHEDAEDGELEQQKKPRLPRIRARLQKMEENRKKMEEKGKQMDAAMKKLAKRVSIRKRRSKGEAVPSIPSLAGAENNASDAGTEKDQKQNPDPVEEGVANEADEFEEWGEEGHFEELAASPSIETRKAAKKEEEEGEAILGNDAEEILLTDVAAKATTGSKESEKAEEEKEKEDSFVVAILGQEFVVDWGVDGEDDGEEQAFVANSDDEEEEECLVVELVEDEEEEEEEVTFTDEPAFEMEDLNRRANAILAEFDDLSVYEEEEEVGHTAIAVP